MSYIDKFLGVASMGTTIANVSLLRRFLSGVTIVIALTAVSSMLVGLVMVVGLYGLYTALIHHGLEPQAAVIAVSALALMVAAALASLAYVRWRQLREMPRLINPEIPIVTQVQDLAEAFISGLLAGRRHPDS